MGTDFYGRSELLSKVQKALQTSNVVLLQGQRRIGKTSFLKQLSVFLKSAEGMQAFQAPLVPVIFDIQRYVQDTLPQFQWHLAEAIARELQLTAPSLPEWEANHALFQDVWLPQVYEKLGDRDLAILVDEFDNLEGQSAPQAMQTLIPFLGQLVSSETRLKWVLTLGRQTGKLPIQYDPIESAGQSIRLGFLSHKETRELIETPATNLLTYQPEAIDRIYQLTNGQPHLTQALGSEVFQRVAVDQERELVEAADVDEIVPHVLETYSNAISSIVKVPPLEERVLAAVAQLASEHQLIDRQKIANLLVRSNIQLSIDELTNTLESLLTWDLLQRNSQHLRISVKIIELWIAENILVEPNREESEDIRRLQARYRYEFAEKARQAGGYDIAIKDYEEALSLMPNYPEALQGLAEAYRLAGKLADRVKTLRKLRQYDSRIQNSLEEALSIYVQQTEQEENFSLAIELYREQIELRSSDQAFQGLARCLVKEFDSYEKVLEKAPKDIRVLQAILEQYEHGNDWKAKIATLEKLYENDQFFLAALTQALEDSSLIAEERGDFDLAIQNYKRLCEIQDSEVYQKKLVIDLMRRLTKILEKELRDCNSTNRTSLFISQSERLIEEIEVEEKAIWKELEFIIGIPENELNRFQETLHSLKRITQNIKNNILENQIQQITEERQKALEELGKLRKSRREEQQKSKTELDELHEKSLKEQQKLKEELNELRKRIKLEYTVDKLNINDKSLKVEALEDLEVQKLIDSFVSRQSTLITSSTFFFRSFVPFVIAAFIGGTINIFDNPIIEFTLFFSFFIAGFSFLCMGIFTFLFLSSRKTLKVKLAPYIKTD
ncbi:nSTAND1 domain-containing NTPase [Leptolyngbya sp. GGD]|uniref:nSTAND1 domain-containing NTPase n=1 Tax=Leptolyngbya sp. GGD TaxID=2997907 RepID=UPI00227A4145|nr:hypothetical protein [Leptolyngbya sp. GGD]MCY6491645.1 hypothetical protein [Leptolyngbya sp. GGD]